MSLEQDVYDALTHEGFTMAEAAGIMGNLENESSFNPEAVNPGGPTAGVGLAQWETTYYPAAAGYVTGNVGRDLSVQAQAIKSAFQSEGLGGGSAAQVAGEWASQFEKCAGCQPGGEQYEARVANAEHIYAQAQSGNWGSGSGVSGNKTGTVNTDSFDPLNPGDWVEEIASIVPGLFGATGWADMFERLGLIIIGGLMFLMGLSIFFQGGIKTFDPAEFFGFKQKPSEPAKKTSKGKADEATAQTTETTAPETAEVAETVPVVA